MAKTTKREELIAHAIWHTPMMPVYDKRELARHLAEVMGVNDAEDFVRLASDPAYGPTGPAMLPTEQLVEAKANTTQGDSLKNWEMTPEMSGPVVPPGHKSRKQDGPTPDAETAQEKANS